jgi:GAF domain-containing protein
MTELDALHETAVLVAERHEMAELHRLILTRAAVLVGVEDAFLHLLEPDREKLVVVAGIGAFSELIGSSVRLGEGLAGRVAAADEPLAESNHGSNGVGSQKLGPMTSRMTVAAPLRGTEGILGVIGLERGGSLGFDEDEVALLGRFGRVAAIALDNARLHETLQSELAERRRTEEELLDTVSRLSRSELELRRAQAETIRKLADAAEFRDAETGHHTERMSRMCEKIAAGYSATRVHCTTSARSRFPTRSCSNAGASPTRSVGRCSVTPRSVIAC